MIKKLRRKFVCIIMLIVTFMLIVIMGLTMKLTQNSLEAENLAHLREAVQPEKKDHHADTAKPPKPFMTNNTEPSATETPSPTEGSTLDTTQPTKASEPPREKNDRGNKEGKHIKHPTFTLTYSSSGELVAIGSDVYDLSDPQYLETIYVAAKAKNIEHGILWSHSLRFLRSNPEGTSYIYMDISNDITFLQGLLFNCLMVGSIVFIGFLILSIFLSRWVVKPVEQAWEQQQQFIADASHELKTPLTAILTSVELLEDPNIAHNIREKCVKNISETSHRMRSLTEEMLTLARTQNMQEDLMQDNCSLSQILEDEVLSFEPLFYERGLELQTDIEPSITTKGNQLQLQQLNAILLDNAQKYSLPGTVRLSLKKHGFKTCELQLSNPSTPIAPEDLEKIFERFYRIDAARTADGSYGLGLSIALNIVRRHQGSIKAEYRDGEISFRVRLPIIS